eukprot:4458879-Prymnesium_polylepis.1
MPAPLPAAARAAFAPPGQLMPSWRPSASSSAPSPSALACCRPLHAARARRSSPAPLLAAAASSSPSPRLVCRVCATCGIKPAFGHHAAVPHGGARGASRAGGGEDPGDGRVIVSQSSGNIMVHAMRTKRTKQQDRTGTTGGPMGTCQYIKDRCLMHVGGHSARWTRASQKI